MLTTDSGEMVEALKQPVWQTPVMPLSADLWLHSKARQLTIPCTNTLINLSDGGLLTISGDQACISTDGGEKWTLHPLFSASGIKPSFEHALVRSASGAIVFVFMDAATTLTGWDNEKHEATVEPRRDTLAIRSLDEGRTWSEPVVLTNYTGCIIHGITTTRGRLVVPIQRFVRNPDHWAQRCFVSDDVGRTWTVSNTVDVGGHGHHDGGFEGTVVELTDGRLWMLLRTNLDCFWQTYSNDQGLTWSDPAPTDIDASSAPAWLQRLSSGRLIMAWNRLYSQGATQEQIADFRFGGDCNTCRTKSSWHRHELSIAFSEDDGAHWSEPIVLARDRRLAYPTILERSPGLIWVTTRFSQRIAIAFREADFAG